MRRLFKEPLLHFLLIGAGLFLLFGWRGGPASFPAGTPGQQSAKIVVTQGDIDQMVGTFTQTWQRSPTEEEVKGLVEDFIRNEIYYRAAVEIGLDRDDSMIRRRMRQKMEFIFEDISSLVEPTEEELLAYMKKHPDSYLIDPQIAFRQVYVIVDGRRKNAEADARHILGQLNKGIDPDTVGDPFLMGSEVRLSSLWEIKSQFGEEFSKSLLELKPGRWQGPIRSGFGLHLVFVTKRQGERPPELKEVRDIVKRDWAAERQKELKDAAYARLRERYVIVVEKPNAEINTVSVTTRGGAQK